MNHPHTLCVNRKLNLVTIAVCSLRNVFVVVIMDAIMNYSKHSEVLYMKVKSYSIHLNTSLQNTFNIHP